MNVAYVRGLTVAVVEGLFCGLDVAIKTELEGAEVEVGGGEGGGG